MKKCFALLIPLALMLPSSAARPPAPEESALDYALRTAEAALAKNDLTESNVWVDRALERDPKSIRAWDLRARCAKAVNDNDGHVYALHRELQLAIAQKSVKAEIDALRARVIAVDPVATDLFGLSQLFVAKLTALAEQYEKDGRPHSAIRVHKEILALDPDSASSAAAIQRLAGKPDPSLAGDAKPKDLLDGISTEWIRDFDKKHATWKEHAKLEREHYVTHTDTGYANLVRAAEAMEQMNAFYRQFFNYGAEGDSRVVPRIDLMIFNSHDEYLKLGSNPAKWSGGQFTGATVETYVGEGGFDTMVGTLFHESAHQFVSLATTASGWLNEGLASFFEGCRILSNGTVIMNLPANHRLFPMVQRLKEGWMTSASDGMDPKDVAKSDPKKAPTFRIVMENEYEWGPAWYAPTWAVVYFLYNYQDLGDGRYVYRAAFHNFMNSSGGRVGKGAVKNFEQVVLASPEPPIKGVVRPKDAVDVRLPTTIDELDAVWKDWLIALAQEQNGELEVKRPWLQWARNAIKNKDDVVAREHFEKALIAGPQDVDTLLEFAAFLAERKENDRATKLALEAVRILESREPVDAKALQNAEKNLEKWDPKRKALDTVHHELWAAGKALVARYKTSGLWTMVMDLAWHLGTDLNAPGMMEDYAEAVRNGGKPLQLWQLAYNERSLDGWNAGPDTIYSANGQNLVTKFGAYDEKLFDFRVLALEATTSGDYSFEAEVLAEKGKVNFCGIVFGKKDDKNFHGLILFPGKVDTDGSRAGFADTGFIDLTSCFGGTSFKTWRHNPVKTTDTKPGETGTAKWHKLRIDVAGSIVDTWFDGTYQSTQDFGSVDVLRGGFGIIAGPGTAQFQRVRFLARPLNDPAAKIDREIRLEKLQSTAGAPINGSYIGLVPPFPKVTRWLQNPRKKWDEKGLVPQVLVLWSIAQNKLVPIDGWLNELHQKFANVGLELVLVDSVNDAADVASYLGEHPMPGSIAVDTRDKPGIGATFEMYSVDRFNLPRVLLFDIDGRVVWEGDPGFSAAEPWKSDAESFLDAPLSQLVTAGKLPELVGWLTKWKETGEPALSSGDLATALPLMRAAKEFPAGRTPATDAACKKLDALEAALTSLKATAQACASESADPAVAVLAAYMPLFKHPIDKPAQFLFAQYRDDKISHEWDVALKSCDKIKTHAKSDAKLTLAVELLTKLAKHEGRFSKDLAAELGPAVDKGDVEAVQRIVTDAPLAPAKWLLETYLK